MSTASTPIATIPTGFDEGHVYRLAIYRTPNIVRIAEESRKVNGETWGEVEVVEVPFEKFHQFLDGLIAAKGAPAAPVVTEQSGWHCATSPAGSAR